MAPVENNFPPRGPKIVLGRRLLAVARPDSSRKRATHHVRHAVRGGRPRLPRAGSCTLIPLPDGSGLWLSWARYLLVTRIAWSPG